MKEVALFSLRGQPVREAVKGGYLFISPTNCPFNFLLYLIGLVYLFNYVTSKYCS